MSDNWSIPQHSQKGTKGFLKKDSSNVTSEQIIVRLTENQKGCIVQYCNDKAINISDLVRSCLAEKLGDNYTKDYFKSDLQTNLLDLPGAK